MSITKSTKYPRSGMWELLIIALPMMASNACDTIMTFVGRLFLSKIGSAQMNAALGGGLMCFMLMTFFIGIIGYSTALVAQYYGAGQKHNCSRVVTQAMIIAVIAYPIILIISPLARMMFKVSGISAEQIGPQTVYFNILVFGSIIGLLRSALSSFFSGIGRTRIVMLASLGAMAVDVIVNYILIFGNFGFPAMGIRGAAYGAIAGGSFGLLILAIAYFGGKEHSEFGIASSFKFDSAVMRKLLKFGYPGGFEFFLNFAAFNGMVMLFQSCGQAVATAATVTFNWDMVAFVPLIGIEIGVTSLVGRYMGARNPEKAHSATMAGLKIGSIYSGIMLLMFLLFPLALVNVFKPDVHRAVFDEALPLTLFMVRLVAVYVLVEAWVIAFSGALRGAGDTFWAMCTSVSLHWFLVLLLGLMLKRFNLSPEIAWVTMIVWFMIFSLLFFLRYRAGKWKQIQVIHNTGEEKVPVHDEVSESNELGL